MRDLFLASKFIRFFGLFILEKFKVEEQMIQILIALTLIVDLLYRMNL